MQGAVAVHERRDERAPVHLRADLLDAPPLRVVWDRMGLVGTGIPVIVDPRGRDFVSEVEEMGERPYQEPFVQAGIVLQQYPSPEFHHDRPMHGIQLGGHRVTDLRRPAEIEAGPQGEGRHEGVGREFLLGSAVRRDDCSPVPQQVA